ncbi:MAG: phage tail assembly chaperone [Oceanicaulis sp.]
MSPRWAAWFAAGVGRFGLSPDAFWSLTLAEWRALISTRAGPRPLGRTELDALLKLDAGRSRP